MFNNIFSRQPKIENIDWHLQRRYVVLRLLVPKTNDKTPLAAEQFFAALHGIFQSSSLYQETISLEIAAVNGYVQFYIATPEHLKSFIEGQLYAQYPTVEIEPVEDYFNAMTPESSDLVTAEINLKKEDVYPIKTFLNFDVDPLASITGVLSEASGQEFMLVQILIKPASDSWQDRGIDTVKNIKSGQKSYGSISEEFKAHIANLGKNVFQRIISPPKPDAKSIAEAQTLSAPVEAALKGIEEKITKLGYVTLVRAAVLSPSKDAAIRKLQSIVGAFKQYNTNNMNSFTAEKIIEDNSLLKLMQRRYFQKGYLLNIEELASIYHLPSTSVETPRIAWSGSKKGEPPMNLPVSVQDSELTKFGVTNFRGKSEEFGIKQVDRSLHMYAIGKTGTGKSTLLENMAIEDIRKGRGVAVIDPHGDLIKNIINFIPEDRVEDVIVFNPADREHPVAFNILENVDPDLKNIVASGVVGIFKKIFGESWGPRLEYILRNTILALLDYDGATMLGILRVLNDSKYRLKVIEKLQDPVIKDFFINEYEKYDQKFRTEAIAPIQNKVGQFLSASTIRNIVGQKKSSINIEDAMNNGKILLLDLSIGKIGEDNSALLGSMMITKMQLAAMSRANIPLEERINFYLYVDEFQNFATDSFAVILSEARKYRLNLIMTNQYIAQMPETVANAVFGNIGTLISFRVGAADAAALSQEFEPVFIANDLVNLDNYNIYLKMAIEGVTSVPFSAKTLPPAHEPCNLYDKIITRSQEKYGHDKEEVEKDITVTMDLGGEVMQDFMKSKQHELEKTENTVILNNKYKKIIDANNDRWFYRLHAGAEENHSQNAGFVLNSEY